MFYMPQNYAEWLQIQPQNFEEKALSLFRYQAQHCKIYKDYLFYLNISPSRVHYPEHIPFLPIEFFKQHEVKTHNFTPERVFSSSGTSNTQTSQHFVADLQVYRASFELAFSCFYGDVKNYCVLALLPSYLERQGSSLVYMAQQFITQSGHERSGFYVNDYDELLKTLEELALQNQKVLLLGVTFALLHLARNYSVHLGSDVLVMETGGMKGRGKELVRAELHQVLCGGLGVERIHSEYGMTELLSQAYSKGKGIFYAPPHLKIFIRDAENPLYTYPQGKAARGGINAIDFANVHSCAFVATQDLGRLHTNGSFEVLGRFDYSDVRGCNLLLA